MTTSRQEFSANDAAPAVLYAKTDADSKFAYPLLANASGYLLLSASAPSSIGDGSMNVTMAGTRVQLTTASTTCIYVIVTAKTANTDVIWLGGSTVAAGSGRPLVALQSEKIDIGSLNKVYIDSVVNGEGVTFVYVA